MDVGHFDKPVRIFIEERGTIADNVTSTAQAADILLHRWPGDPAAKKHLNARIACIAVLEGLKEARAARLAFEAAAAEANILAPMQTFVPTNEGPKLWKKRTRKLKRDE
jgi:hypothetical protein